MKHSTTEIPFWQYKTLNQMTKAEWESLCDGCGRCCMHKLEDEDSGDIYNSSVGCKLLNGETCLCNNYPSRKSIVPDCIQLTQEIIETVKWLPDNCAYRLISDGKDLEWWHHLVSGSRETIHEAGISVRGKVLVHEDELHDPEDYLQYVTEIIYKNLS
ncbi:YcgN family cysteine cluster protein [Bartonella sp. HY406]|uniref:YcgN family cysteine cluster protein n=1 Tax=Bartonella sp. HY406 TaxID=2979331 RepID=UPI0021C7AA03|nr:YcgN family cysteine cluster protein [Bartonella sp. HY406]UXN03545.1 YcgN family cysteine cluster protein [Bartonella sp. HY406]